MTDRLDQRRRTFVAIAACVMFWQSAYAITLRGPHDSHSGQLAAAETTIIVPVAAADPVLTFEPTTAPPGTPVKLLFTPPTGQFVTVHWSDFAFGIQWDGDDFTVPRVGWVWPLAGDNPAGVKVQWVADGAITEWQHVATHTSGAPPPPKPLKELAGGDAPALSAFYAKLAGSLALIESADDFWGTHDAGLALTKLEGHGARAVLTARLTPITADPFDAAKVEAELRAIVAELGAPTPPKPDPPGPVVVDGKRRFVILHETADTHPELARMFTALRTGEAAAYLTAKGHTLDIFDDDEPSIAALGGPGLYVLDAATGAVLHKQALPADAAAVLAVLKQHGGQ